MKWLHIQHMWFNVRREWQKTCSSWLMYYLGSENEEKFVSTAVKLGYSMLTKEMDDITAATMCQESNIQKNLKELY